MAKLDSRSRCIFVKPGIASATGKHFNVKWWQDVFEAGNSMLGDSCLVIGV